MRCHNSHVYSNWGPCPYCTHQCAPLPPRFWCWPCCRYTHTQHYHPTVIWNPVPIQPIISGAQQRDRNTIRALAG